MAQREHHLILGAEALLGIYLANLQWTFARWPVDDDLVAQPMIWQRIAAGRFGTVLCECAAVYVVVLLINRRLYRWLDPSSSWPLVPSLLLPALMLTGAVWGLILFLRDRPYF